jgi:transcriptional regulator NrdR family protein
VTWKVKTVTAYCPMCIEQTRQIIAEEKADMNGIVIRTRSCKKCGERVRRWIHTVLTPKTA